MKALLFLLAFLSVANAALPLDHGNSSNSVWIDTNTVLISNHQSPEIARRDCDTSMRILNIMSNDRIVFNSTCAPTYNPRCNFQFCYQLSVRALIIGRQNVE